MVVDSGWLQVLAEFVRSDNKQVRLATVKALENLMKEGTLSLSLPVAAWPHSRVCG